MAIIVDNSGAPYSVTLTITGGVSVPVAIGSQIARLTLDTSAYSYSGDLMVEINETHLGESIVSAIAPDDQSIRFYQSQSDAEAQINAIPAHTRFCKPRWFTNHFSHGVGTSASPSAWFDATENVTAIAGLRGGFHQGSVIAFDHATGAWGDPIDLGFGDATGYNPPFDSHGLMAVIKHNGTWHAAGLAHASAVKYFTASNVNGPWVEQANIAGGAHFTYPRFVIVEDDLVLFLRDDSNLAQRDQVYLLLSEGFTTKHRFVDASVLPAANIAYTATESRAYLNNLAQIDATTMLVGIYQHETYSEGWEARTRHFVFKLVFSTSAGQVTGFQCFKVNDTALCAAETEPSWSDLNTGDVMVAGWPGDPAVATSSVEAIKGPWRSGAAVWVDSSGHAHMAIRETITGSTTAKSAYTARISHFSWDGSAWSRQYATGVISGLDKDFPRVSQAQAESGLATLHYTTETGIKQLVFSGASWSEAEITNLPETLADRTCYQAPVSVQSASDSIPYFKWVANQRPAIIGTNNIDDIGGAPMVAWNGVDALAWPYVRLVVKPTLTSGSDATLYLRWGDSGLVAPAKTDAEGEYAVYSDWILWRWCDMQTTILQRGYGGVGPGVEMLAYIDGPHSSAESRNLAWNGIENGSLVPGTTKAPTLCHKYGIDFSINDSAASQAASDGTVHTAAALITHDFDIGNDNVFLAEVYDTGVTDSLGYGYIQIGDTTTLRLLPKINGDTLFDTTINSATSVANTVGATSEHRVISGYLSDSTIYIQTNELSASNPRSNTGSQTVATQIFVGGTLADQKGGIIGAFGYTDNQTVAGWISNGKLEAQVKILYRRRDPTLVSLASMI